VFSDVENDMWALLSDETTMERLALRKKVREDLRKHYTKQLLDMRVSWSWHYDLPHEDIVKLLYEELARREHVRNKPEGRAHRRAMAAKGSSNRGSKRELKKKPKAQ
jgi:hypothetical protein